MAFTRFLKELASGFPFSSYLLHSGDYYLLYEAFTRIKDAHGGDAFNIDVFDGDSPDSRPSMDVIIDTLNTLPFAAPRRTVVIRNLQKYPKNECRKMEAYVNRPSDTSLCIMLYEGKLAKSFDDLKAPKVRRIPLAVSDHEIIPFIIDKGKKTGIEVDSKTAEHLISLVGSELGALCSEIDKLAALGKSALTREEIRTVVYSDIEYTAFDLANALGRGDAHTAFTILESLTKSAEPHMVLGALNWHYKNAWTRGGKNQESLSQIFSLLHSADVSLKTSRQAVLEDLLWKILQVTRAVAAAPVRPAR